MVRSSILSVVLACCTVLVFPWVIRAADPDIVGKYKCDGTLNGKPYTGTVEITKRGDGYQLTWDLGIDTFAGAGLLDGDVFAVSFEGEKKDADKGLLVYRFENKGANLVGKGIRKSSQGMIYKETLTRMK